jgi:hypothetical protein
MALASDDSIRYTTLGTRPATETTVPDGQEIRIDLASLHPVTHHRQTQSERAGARSSRVMVQFTSTSSPVGARVTGETFVSLKPAWSKVDSASR